MPKLTHLFGFIIGTTFVGVSRFLMIGIGGFILNLILFFYLPDLCNGTRETLQVMGICFGKIMLGIGFLIVAPLWYFWLAKDYALGKTIRYAYVKNKPYFYEYLTAKMTHFISKEQNKDIEKGNQQRSWSNLAGSFFDTLSNMPFIFKIVLNFVKNRIPFTDVFDKISTNVNLENKSIAEAASAIAKEADDYIEDDLLDASTNWLMATLVVNLVFFVLLRWTVPVL